MKYIHVKCGQRKRIISLMSCRVVNDTKIIGILNFMIEVVEKNHTLAVHLYIYIYIIGIV